MWLFCFAENILLYNNLTKVYILYILTLRGDEICIPQYKSGETAMQ